jgi:hypothetical protein
MHVIKSTGSFVCSVLMALLLRKVFRQFLSQNGIAAMDVGLDGAG